MSTATMRTRLAKLEKRQQRLVGRELKETELARRIGYSLYCAAYHASSENCRTLGRRIAVLFGRNRQRTGSELSPGLADLLLRTLVGEAAAPN